MTEIQFKKYQKLKEEIEPIKTFLEWCGNKYKRDSVGKYNFNIETIGQRIRLIMKRYFCSIPQNTYEMPNDLQERIINTIEQYVDEKQKELDEI